MADIDIRPVPVDKLVTQSDVDLQNRYDRLLALDAEYAAKVDAFQKDLTEAQHIYRFIQKELANVKLAQQLARGDVVRVTCPTCKGTGMKPADVTGGRLFQQGSAFEQTRSSGVSVPPVIDERNRCPECQGQRWQIMERFKG